MAGIMKQQPRFDRGTHPLLQLSPRMLHLQSAINDLISFGPRCRSVSVFVTGQSRRGDPDLDKFEGHHLVLCFLFLMCTVKTAVSWVFFLFMVLLRSEGSARNTMFFA